MAVVRRVIGMPHENDQPGRAGIAGTVWSAVVRLTVGAAWMGVAILIMAAMVEAAYLPHP